VITSLRDAGAVLGSTPASLKVVDDLVCKSCGTTFDEFSRFCQKCGTAKPDDFSASSGMSFSGDKPFAPGAAAASFGEKPAAPVKPDDIDEPRQVASDTAGSAQALPTQQHGGERDAQPPPVSPGPQQQPPRSRERVVQPPPGPPQPPQPPRGREKDAQPRPGPQQPPRGRDRDVQPPPGPPQPPRGKEWGHPPQVSPQNSGKSAKRGCGANAFITFFIAVAFFVLVFIVVSTVTSRQANRYFDLEASPSPVIDVDPAPETDTSP